MKKLNIFMVLLLISSIVPYIFTADAATPNENNSAIIVLLSEIAPETTTEISVRAADDTNTAINNANITLTCTEGLFTLEDDQSITGNSDINGFLNLTWLSPTVSFTDLYLNVTFQAEITSDNSTILVANFIIVKHLDNTSIAHSELLFPATATSGENVDLSTWVKDISDFPTESMQVTYITAEGNPLTAIQGNSDTIGFFNLTWQAPVLEQTEVNRTVPFTVLIEASSTINITLNTTILVELSTASELSITITAPSTLVSEGETEILISVFAGSSPAYGGSVYISVDDGILDGITDYVDRTVNSSGYVLVNYTAPSLGINQSILLNVEAEYLLLQNNTMIEIEIYPSEYYFYVEMDIDLTEITQSETLEVSLTIEDYETGLPVEDAQVTLLLDIGIWEESGTQDYVTYTDSTGIISATFNGTFAKLAKTLQEVNITATILKDNYVTYEISDSFLLERVDTYSFNISVSTLSIHVGDQVKFIITAELNGDHWPNATFVFSTSEGEFPDGEIVYYAKTNNTGVLEVIWNSSIIEDPLESLSIYFTIELTSRDGLAPVVIPIMIEPIDDNNTGTDTNTTPSDNGGVGDILLIAGVVIVLGGAGAIIIVKK